jgi:hypothetical protein
VQDNLVLLPFLRKFRPCCPICRLPHTQRVDGGRCRVCIAVLGFMLSRVEERSNAEPEGFCLLPTAVGEGWIVGRW